MKQDIREKLIRTSNLAMIGALAMTSCFTGCKQDANVTETEDGTVNNINGKEYLTVDENNAEKILSFNKIELGDGEQGNGEATTSRSEYNAVSKYAPVFFDEAHVDEIKDGLANSGRPIGDFGKHEIYRDTEGGLVLIESGEALKLMETSDNTYKIEKSKIEGSDDYVLIDEEGNRTFVVGSAEALTTLTSDMEKKYDEIVAEGKKGILINGITFNAIDTPISVKLFNGEQAFVKAQQVLDVCIQHIESLGLNEGAISYEVKDNCLIVTRQQFTISNGEITRTEFATTLPFGKEGETYYDKEFDVVVPYSFVKDGEVFVSVGTFELLLGISMTNGSYNVPGSDAQLEDIILVGTYGGIDSPSYEIVLDKEITIVEDEQVVQDYFNDETEWEVKEDPYPIYEENVPTDGNYNIDAELTEKFGFDIPVLTGTPQEKAQQLCDIVQSHYPTVPFTVEGHGFCIDWPDDIEIQLTHTAEECLQKCYEILGGEKDLMTLTVEEAYSCGEWLAGANYDAKYRINEMTSHTFSQTTSGQISVVPM